jgi:hypothetical protein
MKSSLSSASSSASLTGFDPRVLWQTRPVDPASICRIVPPELPAAGRPPPADRDVRRWQRDRSVPLAETAEPV